MRIAFCGLGLMGAPMAARLVDAGHEVTVWNRTAARTDPLVEKGARRAATPAEAARGAEVAITMLATPEAVREVVLGPEGLAAGLPEGGTLIDMSTVGPALIRELAAAMKGRAEVVDAPVLGSVPQATEGTLKIYFGGAADTLARLRPVLEAMGTVLHVGPTGHGAALKLTVNGTLGAAMTALGEALALAGAFGLDEKTALDALEDSPLGGTVKKKRHMLTSGRYPPNFRLHLAVKDMTLVETAARDAGAPTRVASAARRWFEEADAAGLSDLDYSAVIAHIRGRQATR